MVERLQGRDDWERKEALASALVEFLEAWVVRDLSRRFRTAVEALYAETPEQRLLLTLVEDTRPLSLRQISAKCSISRGFFLPDKRLRRAIERLERNGIVSRSNGPGEEKPRYSLNRENLTSQLLVRVFSERTNDKSLVAASISEGFRPAI
jgi:hypothetical protein